MAKEAVSANDAERTVIDAVWSLFINCDKFESSASDAESNPAKFDAVLAFSAKSAYDAERTVPTTLLPSTNPANLPPLPITACPLVNPLNVTLIDELLIDSIDCGIICPLEPVS